MNELPPIVIGIAGDRSAGKDTLASRLAEIDPRCRRWSYAAALKDDLAPFISEHYDVDVHTVTGEMKEVIRPILIAHGMAKRALNANHWCDRVRGSIVEEWRYGFHVSQRPDDKLPFIPVISDVRFENEVKEGRAAFGGGFIVVWLEREGAPPPTDEELRNRAAVKALADYELKWGNDTVEGQLAHAKRLYDWIGGVYATGW